jgi:hypothetical protein
VRRGQQPGIESHIASVMADPLVKTWMQNKLTGLGEDQSTKRANLPDASQALTGGGRFGAAGSGVPGAARRPSAASRAVAPAGPSAGATGATAFTWPDGRPVTLQQANDPSIPMAIRQTWKRNTPLPSGARTPRSATSRGEGGLLDPLFSRLRG